MVQGHHALHLPPSPVHSIKTASERGHTHGSKWHAPHCFACPLSRCMPTCPAYARMLAFPSTLLHLLPFVQVQTIKTAIESAQMLLRIDDIVSGISRKQQVCYCGLGCMVYIYAAMCKRGENTCRWLQQLCYIQSPNAHTHTHTHTHTHRVADQLLKLRMRVMVAVTARCPRCKHAYTRAQRLHLYPETPCVLRGCSCWPTITHGRWTKPSSVWLLSSYGLGVPTTNSLSRCLMELVL